MDAQQWGTLNTSQAAALRRRKTVIAVSVITVAVILVGVLLAALLVVNRSGREVRQPVAESTVSLGDAAEVPFDVSETRVRVGAADAPVTLALYEDFSCIHCQAYEALIADSLDDLVGSGDVAVEYHPMRIVTAFGNRAGSAATCVAVGDPSNWHGVHRTLFALHDSDSDGWSNRQLSDYLAEEGISDPSVLDCIAGGRYESWIDQNTQAAYDAGVSSTPTLRINGEESEDLGPAELRQAVARILGE